MTDNAANSKRIAKNTAMLYVRMALLMCISLYTSRVVLRELGVVDFGVYNLVGSVVVFFSFLNGMMTSASQRYLSVAIGKAEKNFVAQIFSMSMNLHVSLAILIFVFAEIIGVWFIGNGLNIPSHRMNAAMLVFQASILATSINVVRVPCNAAIIAYEKMDFYAYSSMLEGVLKLAIVWILALLPFDKLITYSILLLAVSIIMTSWYRYYCYRKFPNCKYIKGWNKNLAKEMLSFSGWNLFGALGDAAYKLGTGFVLNIFCGVTLNAVLGITNQVRSTIYSFVSNLQVAANPQIIKSYATEQYDYYQSLVCRISKYSYFLMLYLAIPIMINVDCILKIWLDTPPAYTNIFIVLVMGFALTDCLQGPLWTTMQANGNLKWNQIATSVCLLANLPLTYLAFWLGFPPASLMIIQIIMAIVTLVVRVVFSHRMAHINWVVYIRKTILPIIIVSIIAAPLPLICSTLFQGVKLLIISTLLSLITTTLSIYLGGLDSSEKLMMTRWIKNKIHKR